MENLENQIIGRLNKVLNKYNLAIISKNNHNYKTATHVDDILKNYCNMCVLVEIEDNTIIECYLIWDNIEFMLLGSDCIFSIFDSIYTAHKKIKLYQLNDHRVKTYRRCYILLDKLYNELHSLNKCSCLEEFNIKMDLIGI